jgi:hypothetical protein
VTGSTPHVNRYAHGRYRFIYVGIDFAERHDYTAITVVEEPLYYGVSAAFSQEVINELGDPYEERGWRSPLEISPTAIAELMVENNRWGFEGWPALAVREIRRRRNIGYSRIVREVAKLLKEPPFRNKRPVMGIAADRTGVGVHTIQSLAEHGVNTDAAIFIHGGQNDKRDSAGVNFFNVAQRNLIGYAQGLAEETERDRLKFNPLLPLADIARRELTNFRVNQDPKTNHESFGAPKREGEFDDIVYSVAMACWLRHYHLGTEARWMGEVIGPGARAGSPNPWARLFEKDVAQG